MFKEFLEFVRVREIPKVDNWVCKLFYPVTTIFFWISAAVITQGLFFKDSIKCWTTVYDDKILPRDVINSYCWIHSTYTPKTFYDTPDGEHCENPVPQLPDNDTDANDNNYYSSYQWGYISLFFQGLIYFIPHLIWVMMHGNETKRIVSSIDKNQITQDECGIRYVQEQYGTWKTNYRSLAFIYIICETVNLAAAITQFALINVQFRGEFITYGIEVLHNAWARNPSCKNVLYQIFPRVAQCKFPEFQASGNVVDHYATCVLPVNALNTKIYAFLWFWLSILIICAAILLLYRLLSLPNTTIRSFSLTIGEPRETSKWLSFITEHSNLSVWFVLRLLQKNFEESDFKNLIEVLKQVKPNPESGTFSDLEVEESVAAHCWTTSRTVESPAFRPRSNKWTSHVNSDETEMRQLSPRSENS